MDGEYLLIRIEDVTEWDLPALPLIAMSEDDALMDRVCEATGWDREILRALTPKDLYDEVTIEDEEDETDDSSLETSSLFGNNSSSIDASSPDKAFDTYKPIIELFAQSVEQRFENRDKANKEDIMDPDNFSSLYRGVLGGSLNPMDGFGYRIMDLNDDGVYELLFSETSSTVGMPYYFMDAYTVDNGQIVHAICVDHRDYCFGTDPRGNLVICSVSFDKCVYRFTGKSPSLEVVDDTIGNNDYGSGSGYEYQLRSMQFTSMSSYRSENPRTELNNTSQTTGSNTSSEDARAAELKSQLADVWPDNGEESYISSGETVTLRRNGEVDTPMYKLPDENSSIVAQVPFGSEITMIGTYQHNWILFEYNGKEGYIRDKALYDTDAN